MSSAWGKSWGVSWGNSWGNIGPSSLPQWPYIPLPVEICALDIRGTMRIDAGMPGTIPVKIVFQRTAHAFAQYYDLNGNPRQIRSHVIPSDPKTPAQRARREKMSAAVAAWHLLTADQKNQWKSDASNRRITAFNAFVSAFLKN